LASRFGSADEPVPVRAEPAADPVTEEELDSEEIQPELAAQEAEEGLVAADASRSPRGALIAIWGFTAVTSGTIAFLHLAGAI
jgi:hypothetical protein